MHDWFGLLDLKKFAAKYALDIAQEELCKSLEAKHHSWTRESEVHLTPTFFVNGYHLPVEYSIYDFKAMIPALAAEAIKQNDSNSVFQHG